MINQPEWNADATAEKKLRHIVLIGGDDQNYKSFADINAQFSVIQLAGNIGKMQTNIAQRIDEVSNFSYSTLLPVIMQLHRHRKIDYLYSFFEDALLPSAIIAYELGIQGLDNLSCDLSINKSKLREHLAGSEFEVPYQSCETVADAISLMNRCATDIVLKDQSGCLSENVYICTKPEDVETAFKALKHNDVKKILAEQRLTGKEYSVESLSINGTHTVLGVTEKYPYKNKLFEKCQVFPAPHLPGHTRGAITGYIERLLDKIGHRHGPTHIEIMVSDTGLHLVEINNRIGGDLIWLLVETVTGVDMLQETMHTVLDPDIRFEYSEPHGRHPVAACRALLGKVDIDALLNTLPAGITPLKTSCWSDYPLGKAINKASDRYGYIAVGFDSVSDFDELFEKFDDMVSRAESVR